MISSFKSRASQRRGLLAFALVAGAAASVAARPFAPGISYNLRMVIIPPEIPGMPAQGEMVIAAHGWAAGNRTRLDLDSVPAVIQSTGGMMAGDYILTLDSGRVVVVSPTSKTYSEGPPGMGGLPPELLAQAVFTNVSVNVEDLGVGDAMQGFPTHRYRVTTQYGLAIMGQSLNTSTVQEVWTAQLPAAIHTPFDGSIPQSMAGGSMKELYDKTVVARSKLGTGTAIKSVTTSSITGPMNVTTVQTLEMSNIKQVNVDDAQLKVPDGFTKKP